MTGGKIALAPKSARKFSDKVFNQWKADYSWIEKHPSLPDFAYCKICKQSLQPKRDKIAKHGMGKSHLMLSKKDFKPIIIENITEPTAENIVHSADNPTIIGNHLQVNTSPQLIISNDEVKSADVHNVNSAPQLIINNTEVKSTDVQKVNSSPQLIISNTQVNSANLQKISIPVAVELGSSPAPSIGSGIVHQVKEAGLHSATPTAELTETQLQSLSTASGLRTLELKDGSYYVQDVLIKMLDVHPQEINLGVLNVEESCISVPYAKIQANAQFPSNIRSEIKSRFLTTEGWDVTWTCQEATFKVHKFVLALFSPFLRRLLDENETESCISTPDISCICVKSILCLFYTGSVLLNDVNLTTQIENVLQLLECAGAMQLEKYDKLSEKNQEGTNISFETFRRKSTKRKDNDDQKSRKKKIKIDEDMKENIDDVVHDTSEDYQDNSGISSKKDWPLRRTERARVMSRRALEAQLDKIKVEMEDTALQDIVMDPIILDNQHLTQDDGDLSKDNCYNSDDNIDNSNCNDEAMRERYRDTKTRYYLKGNRHGKMKGVLSKHLKSDLFENAPDDLLSISVCPLCYEAFKCKDEFAAHKNEAHKDAKEKKRGPHCIDENSFKCPKCGEVKEVGHIVWFVKHMKYCGVDEVKAAAILAPQQNDVQEKQDQEKETIDEDVLTCKSGTGKKIHNLSQVLFGKGYDSIWGCRTCYEVFHSKSDLEQHRVKDHDGKLYHGNCYDETSKQYTCMYCNVSTVYSHLVYFIRHLRQCLVDPSVGLSRDHEEEGLDDDTTDDFVDPWGIINKPLKVVNQRSHWVAESLFGKYVSIVYPCHICYNAFCDDRELKEHFKCLHPDTENCVENGPHYNKEKDVYRCPVCKKEVCRNQKNSIYFTYHMKKCLGKTFPVIKTCPKCSKAFNNYRSYMAHQRNNCESNEYLCHICSLGLKSRQDLVRHVQYVHSDARPYMCLKCPKRFKRKADLSIHEQTHNPTLSYSCEHCGKAFNQKRGLKTHIQTHLSYMDKPHQCQFCTMRFVRKQTLDNHMSTHQDTKKFGCDVCGVRVKTKDALRAHRKKVHKMDGHLPPNTELITVEALPAVAANTVISNTNIKEENIITEVITFPIVS